MDANTQQKNVIDKWSTKKLGELCDISAGGTPSTKIQKYWSNGNIPWANSAEINKKEIHLTENFITQEGLKHSSAKIVPKNSVLIALAGQGSTRGKVAVNKIPLSTNQSVAFFIPKKEINYSFLRSDLERRYQELRSVSAGDGGRGGLNLQILKSIKINFPPITKQEHIVSVLEVWDEAIKKLTIKIKIKKEIKKGLMQELLTGKTRLPGFKDTWHEVKLGEIAKRITTGKLDANAMIDGGKYRFYTCAKNYYFINDYAFDTEALLVSGNGANVGYVHYYKGKFNAYQRTYVLDQFTEDILFIKAYLDQFLKRRIDEEKLDGNTPYIKMGTLSNMILSIPTKDEQKAISNIFTTANKELIFLEEQLDLLGCQKKYLLNNLVTGAIRIPETLSKKK